MDFFFIFVIFENETLVEMNRMERKISKKCISVCDNPSTFSKCNGDSEGGGRSSLLDETLVISGLNFFRRHYTVDKLQYGQPHY